MFKSNVIKTVKILKLALPFKKVIIVKSYHENLNSVINAINCTIIIDELNLHGFPLKVYYCY